MKPVEIEIRYVENLNAENTTQNIRVLGSQIFVFTKNRGHSS